MLIDNYNFENYRYEFYLCKSFAPYEIIGSLTECTFDRSVKWQLMNVDELDMSINSVYNDGTENTLYELIKTSNVIRVERYIDDTIMDSQLFHISEIEHTSDEKDIKTIKAYSLQYRMNRIKVMGFKPSNINGDEVPIMMYTGLWDENNISGSGILDYLLMLLENTWTISYITPSLTTSGRYYDISENTVLETMNEISRNYNCIFFFDTLNQSISIYDYNELNNETGLILSNENYIKQYKQKVKQDEIYTRLYVKGKGDITISEANITGQDYVDNFTYFMTTEYMSQGLIDALTALNLLKISKMSIFNGYKSDLSTKQFELSVLESELYDLGTDLVILEDKEDGAIKFGVYDGYNYTYWHNLVLTKQASIDAKNMDIDNKETEISLIRDDILTLSNLVSYTSNLTLAQRQELLSFINSKTESFDTDDVDVLYDLGIQMSSIVSQHQFDIDLDIIDLYSASSESFSWDKIKLGYKVNLYMPESNIDLTPRIVMIQHNYDSSSLSVTVSNKNYLNGELEYLTAIFMQSKKSSTIMDNERDVYKEFDNIKDKVLYDTTPISTTNNPITLEDGTSLLRRGIYMRDAEDSLGQMKILGDRIVFTRDNWDNISVGITSLGITTSGSFKLLSEKTNGVVNLVTIDGNGMKIYGDGTEENGISIYDSNNEKTMYLGSDGSLKISNGYISLTHGENTINIDPTNGIMIINGIETKFSVDANTGAVSISNGSLSLSNNTNRIFLDPDIGVRIQKYNDSLDVWENTFYLDNSGNIHFDNGYIDLTKTISSTPMNKILIDPSVGINISKNTTPTASTPTWFNVFSVNEEGDINLNDENGNGIILDQFGMDTKFIKWFKNMCYNSSFELYDSSTPTATPRPLYWSGGVSTENSSWFGTRSMQLDAGVSSEQVSEGESSPYAKPLWYRDIGDRTIPKTRVSFHKKLGATKIEVLDISNGNAPFTLTASDHTVLNGTYGTSLTYPLNNNWESASYSVVFEHGVSDTTQIKVKFTNVDGVASYIDSVIIEPDYTGKRPSFYTDGPNSLSAGTIGDLNSFVSTQSVYVQDDEPLDAVDKDVWIDTNNYSRYDVLNLDANATLLISGAEFVVATLSGITITLASPVNQAGILCIIKNASQGITIVNGAINNVYTMNLFPDESIHLISDGVRWRS